MSKSSYRLGMYSTSRTGALVEGGAHHPDLRRRSRPHRRISACRTLLARLGVTGGVSDLGPTRHW